MGEQRGAVLSREHTCGGHAGWTTLKALAESLLRGLRQVNGPLARCRWRRYDRSSVRLHQLTFDAQSCRAEIHIAELQAEKFAEPQLCPECQQDERV